MTRSVMSRLRRLWLDAHLWIGVGLLVAFLPLSISGAILVFHDQLDRAMHAQRYAVSGTEASLAPSAYAVAAQGAFGDRAMLSQIRLPQKAGDPVVAVGRLKQGGTGPGGRPRNLNAWIDPPTAKVLDVADVSQGAMMVMHRLHGSLLIPDIGRKVVGWLGWAMFVSTATGVWLWWPRHAGFLMGLRWRRGASQLFNLHHTVGFWLCLPLAILSLTGVYISFPQASRALFGIPEPQRAGAAGPGRPDPRFAPPVAGSALSPDQAVAAATAKAPPGTRLAAINLPQQGRKPAWRIDFAKPDAEGPPAQVRVDDASGKVREGRAGSGGGTPDPLSRWMRRIHDGDDMGIVWRTIITLAGIAPVILGLTGVVMWLRRRARLKALHAH